MYRGQRLSSDLFLICSSHFLKTVFITFLQCLLSQPGFLDMGPMDPLLSTTSGLGSQADTTTPRLSSHHTQVVLPHQVISPHPDYPTSPDHLTTPDYPTLPDHVPTPRLSYCTRLSHHTQVISPHQISLHPDYPTTSDWPATPRLACPTQMDTPHPEYHPITCSLSHYIRLS